MLPRRGSPDWPALVGAVLILGLTVVASIGLVAAGIGRVTGDGDDPEMAGAPPDLPTAVPTAPVTPLPAPTAPPASPTAAPERPLVCLDVGHGGVDLGNVLLNEEETEILVQEKDLTLSQALALRDRLAERGVDAVLTRETDAEVNAPFADINGDGETGTDIDGDGRLEPRDGDGPDELDELQARVNVCNEAGADLLVSIHVNGAENKALQGYEAWYAEGREFSAASERFARSVVTELGEAFAAAGYEAVSRGAGPDTEVGIVDDPGTFEHFVMLSPDEPGRSFVGSTMPGAVVECLFLSNEEDAAFLATEAAEPAIVGAYEAAIVGWLEEEGLLGGPAGEVAGGVVVGPDADGGGAAPATATAKPEPSPRPTAAATPGGDAAPTARPEPLPDDAADGMTQLHFYGDSGRREIALTFDAGADRGYAEEILDFLEERGIRASFGMTGAWAEQNPDLTRRMVDEGHMLFNHTYDHCSFTGFSNPDCRLTSEERIEQIRRTEEIVREVTGGYETAPYFRPPYGDLDDASKRDIAAAGYWVTVMWTCDSLGWKFAAPAQIVQECAGKAEPGGIILLHVGANGTDWEALPGLVAALEGDGYAFVTVEEILRP